MATSGRACVRADMSFSGERVLATTTPAKLRCNAGARWKLDNAARLGRVERANGPQDTDSKELGGVAGRPRAVHTLSNAAFSGRIVVSCLRGIHASFCSRR